MELPCWPVAPTTTMILGIVVEVVLVEFDFVVAGSCRWKVVAHESSQFVGDKGVARILTETEQRNSASRNKERSPKMVSVRFSNIPVYYGSWDLMLVKSGH